MSTYQRYTEEQRIEALARLEGGESQRQVAEAMSIPLPTINRWHVVASESAAAVLAVDGVLDGEHKTSYANRWGRAQKLALERIMSNVEALPEAGLKPSEVQSLAIVAGIATDKHLDYTEGRKGAQIVNDNRQLTVQLTPEQARAMLADAQRQALPSPDNSSSE